MGREPSGRGEGRKQNNKYTLSCLGGVCAARMMKLTEGMQRDEGQIEL